MTRTTKKRLIFASGAFGLIYAALCGGFFWAMSQTPDKFGQIMKHVPMPIMAVLPFEPMWNVARGGDLNIGDAAPDFELPSYDKS